MKQRDHFCGPASLSSVFGYYGLSVDQDTIAKEVYTPKLRASLITDLENYAKKMGFKTELFRGNGKELKEYLIRGIPVIVLVDLGMLFASVPHYLVLVGFDEKGFYAHTGYEPKKFYSFEELDRIWRKMGRVGLAIYR